MKQEAESARSDRILEMLRARGGRVTTSRRAIVGALVGAGGHVSADELARRVQAQHPDVHQSTVYRTLETLAELGVVEHVHFPHGPAVFDLTDMPHHHLVCAECGRIVEVPTSALAPLAGKVERDHGFLIDTQHFALSGTCAECRDRKTPSRSPT